MTPNTRVRVELLGTEQLHRDFDRLGLSVRTRATALINAHAQDLASEAKKNCPVDMGQLRSSIRTKFYNSGLTAEVGTDTGYGAFVEFGTGPLGRSTYPSLFGSVPEGYVWGSGGFFPPLEPIKDWCRRHRIPEKYAFVIARKIGRNGLKAQPYMLPAWEKVRPSFLREMRQLISGFGY